MSILIAYKKDNTIFMGTDTRLIINERKTNKLCKCDYKIQKMDNEMLVGIAGDRIVRQTCFAFSEIFTLLNARLLTPNTQTIISTNFSLASNMFAQL